MTATHPLWRPFDPPSQAEWDAAWVGGPRPVTTRIRVEPWTPDWAADYERLAGSIRMALGGRVIELQHVGSTAVPGLPAKPVIDIDLVVADSADEEAYLPPLELAGFTLVIREPDWEQHRCFVLKDAAASPRCNLHVFGANSVEPHRHRLFRDWLRADEADRVAYGALKSELATAGPRTMADYNSAKSALIYDIYERAFAADPASAHDPHPRPAP